MCLTVSLVVGLCIFLLFCVCIFGCGFLHLFHQQHILLVCCMMMAQQTDGAFSDGGFDPSKYFASLSTFNKKFVKCLVVVNICVAIMSVRLRDD